MTNEVDWCVFEGGFDKLKCLRCGKTFNMNSVLPNSLWVVPAVIKGFQEEHSECEEDDGEEMCTQGLFQKGYC